ncbi:MAG: hypothetical protein ACOH2T_19245 [Pseudomonas sp.]
MKGNSRFRELAPDVEVEMIATRIVFDYTPNGLTTPQQLRATWWGREFLSVGSGHQSLGEQGSVLETILADHAEVILTVTDPVTQQEVTMSAPGAVTWLMAFYDRAHNLQHLPEPPTPEPIP